RRRLLRPLGMETERDGLRHPSRLSRAPALLRAIAAAQRRHRRSHVRCRADRRGARGSLTSPARSTPPQPLSSRHRGARPGELMAFIKTIAPEEATGLLAEQYDAAV